MARIIPKKKVEYELTSSKHEMGKSDSIANFYLVVDKLKSFEENSPVIYLNNGLWA